MGELRIGNIIGTYPDFSTTFIDREIRMMRQWGLKMQLLSIRQPVLHSALSQEQRLRQQEVIYLIPVKWLSFLGGHLRFLLTRPGTYLGTLFYLFTRPHPSVRDRLMTLFHFAEGVYAAHLLREQSVHHLHAHFVDRAATVALVASRLLDIPYSLAVHAGEDIYVHPVLLPEKFAEAKFVISCTQYNLDYLRQLGIPGLDKKAVCIHHGLDVERYPPATQSHEPPLLLAIGRLVEKKGLEYLIRACRQLVDQKREFVCHIIGPGPDRQKLEALIAKLALQDIVKLCGGLPHEKVIEQYDQATLVVLPCIRGSDGSLDGIPNVLAEAMAMKLPVVSTTVSAIPELVQDQVNGLLVPPRDEKALAAALARLLDDPLLRTQLGEKGRQTVRERFDIKQNVRSVYDVFVTQGEGRLMPINESPFKRLGIRALFLVWGAPHGSHRSELMGQQLGTDVQYICFTPKRGKLIAPIKYFFQTIMTFVFLVRQRYQLVFVQDPPIFAVLPVYFYSLFSKARFIIDSHTDALQAPFWKWTLPVHRFLERRAITTIVTNDHLREMIEGWGAHGFTLEDPPAQFHIPEPMTLPDSTLNVVMVSTADYDEPIQEILGVARELQDVDFYVTGDFAHSRYHQGVIESAPQNVHFTGYLREGYFALLDAADVIMCLSTEDNTFLSGSNEALWLGKPLITSDWPILQRYFDKGTIHVDNTAADICRAVITMRDNLPAFQTDILALQAKRRHDWWVRIAQLLTRIQQEMGLAPIGEQYV